LKTRRTERKQREDPLQTAAGGTVEALLWGGEGTGEEASYLRRAPLDRSSLWTRLRLLGFPWGAARLERFSKWKRRRRASFERGRAVEEGGSARLDTSSSFHTGPLRRPAMARGCQSMQMWNPGSSTHRGSVRSPRAASLHLGSRADRLRDWLISLVLLLAAVNPPFSSPWASLSCGSFQSQEARHRVSPELSSLRYSTYWTWRAICQHFDLLDKNMMYRRQRNPKSPRSNHQTLAATAFYGCFFFFSNMHRLGSCMQDPMHAVCMH